MNCFKIVTESHSFTLGMKNNNIDTPLVIERGNSKYNDQKKSEMGVGYNKGKRLTFCPQRLKYVDKIYVIASATE